MKTNDATRATAEAMPECPYAKIKRLSYELSTALAEQDTWTLAMIYPEGAHDYPIVFCHDDQYAKQTRAMFAYRDAHKLMMERFEAFKATPAGQEKMLPAAIKGDTVGYFDAKHACDLAQHWLIRTFDAPVIEGQAEGAVS